MTMIKSLSRAAVITTAAALLTIPAPADAASGYTVHNSARSDWNIGTWTDDHCGGTIHLVAPGHKRSGVRSIKAYGEHNTLIKPNGARSTLVKRHCYVVRGNHWKVKTQGD